MTNMASDSEKTETEAPGSGDKRKRRKWYLVAGVVVVLVVLAAAWRASLIFQLPAPVVHEPPVEALDEIKRRLEAVEHRLEVVASEKPAVMPIASSELWWIAESERYLVEAVERLNSGTGVKPALSALESAHQTLKGVALAEAEPVKRAVETEIQLLRQYRNRDAKQALETIDAILDQLRQPSEGDARETPPVATVGGGEPDGLWARFKDGLTGRFKRLLVIEKKGGGEDRQVTLSVVMRSLMLARIAVIGRDEISYLYAVASAMQAFEQGRETDRELYGRLQSLHALKVSGRPPRIGTALDEIRALSLEVAP